MLVTHLYELAEILRSKNAGPFQLTIDVFFPNAETFDRVWSSSVLDPDVVGRLYSVDPATVAIRPFRRVLAIKITVDRAFQSSGAPSDTDVYGAQQHAPLMLLDIP